MTTKNNTRQERFNKLKDHFRYGDSAKLAEMSGKSAIQCHQIIKGIRRPQNWFLDVAEDYLKTLGRI